MQFNWKKTLHTNKHISTCDVLLWLGAETMSMDYGNTKYALLTVKQAFSQDKWL